MKGGSNIWCLFFYLFIYYNLMARKKEESNCVAFTGSRSFWTELLYKKNFPPDE